MGSALDRSSASYDRGMRRIPTATRRLGYALVALPVAAVLGACGSDASTAPAGSATAANTAAPGTAAGTASDTGMLTLRYAAAEGEDLGDLGTLGDRLVEALSTAGYTARAQGGPELTVEVADVTLADRDAIVAAIGLDARRVLLRPVFACSTPDTPASAPVAVPVGSDGEVVALLGGGECAVGPAVGDGSVFELDAAAQILPGDGWGVVVGLRAGPDGTDVVNALAASCFGGDPTCPSHQLAIQVDGRIATAPTVSAPEFAGSVQVAGDFSEATARELAGALLAGSAAGRLTLADETFVAG